MWLFCKAPDSKTIPREGAVGDSGLFSRLAIGIRDDACMTDAKAQKDALTSGICDVAADAIRTGSAE